MRKHPGTMCRKSLKTSRCACRRPYHPAGACADGTDRDGTNTYHRCTITYRQHSRGPSHLGHDGNVVGPRPRVHEAAEEHKRGIRVRQVVQRPRPPIRMAGRPGHGGRVHDNRQLRARPHAVRGLRLPLPVPAVSTTSWVYAQVHTKAQHHQPMPATARHPAMLTADQRVLQCLRCQVGAHRRRQYQAELDDGWPGNIGIALRSQVANVPCHEPHAHSYKAIAQFLLNVTQTRHSKAKQQTCWSSHAPPMRNPTAAPAVVNCTMMLVAVFEKPSNCDKSHTFQLHSACALTIRKSTVLSKYVVT